MAFIKVIIERFVDPSQPGFVECSLTDARNKMHLFQDKIPVFTTLDLDENSPYPQEGVLDCEVLKYWMDTEGRSIITITTERPWYVDSTEGLYEFDLLKEQVIIPLQ